MIQEFLNIYRKLYKSRIIWLYSLVTFFALSLSNLGKALIVHITHNPLHPILTLALDAAAFILASAAFYMLISEASRMLAGENAQPQKRSLGTAAAVATVCSLFLCAVELFRAFFVQLLESFSLVKIGLVKSILFPATFANLAFMLLAVLLAVIAFLACCLIILENLPPRKSLTAVLKAMSHLFHHPGRTLLPILFTLILCIPAVIIAIIVLYILHQTSLSSFLRLFYQGLAVAATASLPLIFLTGLVLQGMSHLRDKIGKYFEKPAKPAFLLFIPALAAAALLATTYRLPDVEGQLIKAVRLEYELGELYRAQNQLDLSGYHYERGYTLGLSASAFMELQMAYSNPTFSQDEKNQAVRQYDSIVARILKTQPSLGFLYYFQAQRYIMTNQLGESAKYLETARDFYPGLPNAAYQLVGSYDSNEKESLKSRKLIDDIIDAGLYKEWRSLDQISLKDLESLSKQLDYMAEQCALKIPLIAVDYYENKLYAEALAVLKELQPEAPDNLLVNYLISITDLELKSDGKAYKEALDAAKRIAEKYPEEKWAVQYRASIANKAHNAELSESLLKELYDRYPGDNAIAEQYAYILIQKNKTSVWQESDKTAEEIINRVLKSNSNRWYPHFAKTILDLRRLDYSSALKHLIQFKKLASKQSGLERTYDKDYNLISIRYGRLMNKPEAVAALEAIKETDQDTYNYINGAYYWSIRDFDKAEPYLKAYVAKDSGLSRPWFLLGNVYFERGVRDKQPEQFIEAEIYYKKSLAISPEDPFCWFSLGHLYKRMEKPEEAMGAFKQVMYYMPAEDHRDDYWGVSVHTEHEIAALDRILGE